MSFDHATYERLMKLLHLRAPGEAWEGGRDRERKIQLKLVNPTGGSAVDAFRSVLYGTPKY